MFDRIALNYDGTNRILSLGLDRHWRQLAIGELAPVPGGTYLDLGCGTADVAIEIVKHETGAIVVGLDPSRSMLAVGQEKISRLGIGASIPLVTGDALLLPFEDNSLHGAITSFCIRNVTNRRQAMTELHRVLRPGAKLVILELTDPVGIMRPLFRIYSNVVMPLITRVLSSATAYRYLTDSMTDFPQAEAFQDALQAAGFTSTLFRRLTGGITTLFVASAGSHYESLPPSGG
jgi:demethylmenaquinone methyltransferase/2-methoxy-6-polyprenyl-1,4-benzoquinol methylase